MKTLTNITIQPVIELHPFHLNEKYPRIDGIEATNQFWKTILKKHDLESIEPLKKGFFYFTPSTIDDDTLPTLIQVFLTHFYEENFDKIDACVAESMPGSFEGGISLLHHDEVILIPQCCISFHDYKEWTKIQPSSEFQLIWIGHPWIYYKMKNDTIFLTRMIEKNFSKQWMYYDKNTISPLKNYDLAIEKTGEIIEDNDIIFAIPYPIFKAAITKLKAELTYFKIRLEKAATQLGLQQPAQIANALINGNGALSYRIKDIK